MSTGNLSLLAQKIPEVWRSRRLAVVGNASIKLIRMGGEGIPDECHPEFDELLVVIEGEMELVVDQQVVRLKTGDYYAIPRGAIHRVSAASYGTLLLVDTDIANSK